MLNSANSILTHHTSAQYALVNLTVTSLKMAKALYHLLQEKRLWSSEVYDQIYQYNKSRNSINSGQEEEREKQTKWGASQIHSSLCVQAEWQPGMSERHNQTKTEIENRQGQEDTETGEWVHLLLLLCNSCRHITALQTTAFFNVQSHTCSSSYKSSSYAAVN